MGASIAENLIRSGTPTQVWNRTPPTAPLLADHAITDLGAASGAIVLSVLPDVDQFDTVAPDDVLHRWAVAGVSLIAVLSTTSPNKIEALARRAERAGIEVVDAPMSGGDVGARNGTLSFMVGGSTSAYARVAPVLDKTAGRVTHIGPLGCGAIAKLCNQIVVAAGLAALAEAFVLARRAGLDPVQLPDVFGAGLAGSAVLDAKAANMLSRSYPLGGSVANQLKDLRYAAVVANEYSAQLPVLDIALRLFETLAERGLGELDHSAVQEMYF